jgi:flagellin-like protein
VITYFLGSDNDFLFPFLSILMNGLDRWAMRFPYRAIYLYGDKVLKMLRAGMGKRAISPIVSTILIVAATLIAAVAIIGFVFGVFGSTAGTANIAVTSVFLKSSGTGSVGSITLFNTGTGSSFEVAVVISYRGTTCTLPSLSVTGGGSASPVAGGSTQTLLISVATAGQFCGGVTAVAGSAYNGYVT